MKIYFTDSGGMRQLQECNLSEIKVQNKIASNGVTDRPVYCIHNIPFGKESVIITFGGEKDIGQSLRDAFWKCVSGTFKRSIPVFDVDEWYGNLKFVPSADMNKNKKRKI